MARRSAPLLALVLLATLLVPAASARSRHRAERAAICSFAQAEVGKRKLPQARRATLCLLNRVRAHAGLAPLRLHAKLSRAAQRHSRDMVRHGYFSHDSRDGRSMTQRVHAARYVPRGARSWVLGENIAWGSGALGTPIAVVRGWMRSPGHRANILSSRFRHLGIGIAHGAPNGGPGATYTTDFGNHSR